MNKIYVKICVLTGTRAEYGLLKPIMHGIIRSKILKLQIIVTGMHLSKEFGDTIHEIIKDDFKINDKFQMLPENDSGGAMAIATGEGIIRATESLSKIKPNALIILGDRIEALAGCIAATFLNIPVIHFSGGDTTGGIDESVRHAITKFSHIHFPATEKSAERIKKMGEDEWRIYVVGEPTIDMIMNIEYYSKKEMEKFLNFDLNQPLIVLIQHPDTTETLKSSNQIKETIEAIKELGYQTVIIYPNSDSGGRTIIKKIKEIEHLPYIRTFSNLSRRHYLSLLKCADILVGNSSSGITESPSFHLPTVNIGNRQDGRERSTNILDVGYDRRKIVLAIKKGLFDEDFKNKVQKCINPYGDGRTTEKVIEILEKIQFNNNLLKKKITY